MRDAHDNGLVDHKTQADRAGGQLVISWIRIRSAWDWGGLSFLQMLRRTWTRIGENEILTRASAVAFYAMLALVPIIALTLTVAVQLLPDLTGLTGRTSSIGNMTVDQFQQMLRQALPKEGYSVVEDQIKRIQKDPPFGLVSIGLVVTLWTASSLFLAVIDAMNRILGVSESRSYLKLRLLAAVMTIVQAAILLGALIAIVAGPEILTAIGLSGQAAWPAILIQWVVVVVMILLSFSMTFYVAPDADQKWEWITPGSVFGTLILLAFTLVFRIYIQNFANYNQTYGSLGGVMILLLWFWVTALVFLSAGQMNKVIEDASPVGKSVGQKVDPTSPPDLAALKPHPMSDS